MNDTLNIALLQVLPAGSVAQNLEKGVRCCREAKALGADIALFPEMWSSGYTIPHDREKLAALAVPADGAFVTLFAALAKELEMAVGITFLEKSSAGPKNSVCLFDRRGQLAYKYSKVHICNFDEPDDESVLCAGDGFPVAVLNTAKGDITVGSMICYDREFPESARVLMRKGAELLLVPNACPMEVNRLTLLRGRAYENMLAIATCNYPAPHPDCNGHSTLFDGVAFLPGRGGVRDTCALEAGEGEGICLARLDIALLREYRKREMPHYLHNRRPELYGILAEQ